MHDNFYHWHKKAELKPDTDILEARWKAAAQFAKKLPISDILSLLRLALFSGSNGEFSTRFSASLVKLEPTFPLDKNSELLRVMAAAAVVSIMASPSKEADVCGLGLKAAAFPEARVNPVSLDLITRGNEYLATESERLRPTIYTDALVKSEKQADTLIANLKTAVDSADQAKIGEATQALGKGVIAAIKESHQQLGSVVSRMAEESQFLWWVVNKYSPRKTARRETFTMQDYALTAAAEANHRVQFLPPAASVESLLGEVLSQCKKPSKTHLFLAEWSDTIGVNFFEKTTLINVPELAPFSSLLRLCHGEKKVDASDYKNLHLNSKMKATPEEASRQLFREIVFLRAVSLLP